jgi:hypothetical protein
MRPSFIAFIINGLFIFLSMLYVIYNYNAIMGVQTIILLLLFSIAIGVHAMLHHIEEIVYDFNPFVGKWRLRDRPSLNIN